MKKYKYSIMDKNELEKYCHYAMLASSPRGLAQMKPRDYETLRRTAYEWANEYPNGISLDDLCDLIISQVEHNLLVAWYDKSDIDQVARFTGFFTHVAINANLANDFEEVFNAAFTKFIDK